jgi:hypothetical protein
MDTGNLPSWPGASEVYRKLYALLAYKAQRGWVIRQWERRGWRCSVQNHCNEMVDIIDALDEGNEEKLKAFQLLYLDDIYIALSQAEDSHAETSQKTAAQGTPQADRTAARPKSETGKARTVSPATQVCLR